VLNVLEGFSIIESVQRSIRRDKGRAILEFYLLVLLYSFLNYHASAVAKSLVSIHKHHRKLRMDAPMALLEETRGLQGEASTRRRRRSV
jgi:uncharacterized protein (DUF2225 family)